MGVPITVPSSFTYTYVVDPVMDTVNSVMRDEVIYPVTDWLV